MILKPAKVPVSKVSSVDLTNFGGGSFLNGDQNAPADSFTLNKDVEVDYNGNIVPRRKLAAFLPDTVETTFQKYPVYWLGNIYYFTADDNKIKYCQEGDSGWTDCTGTNSFTTDNGGMCKFIRVLNSVLILNGKNGDTLAYVDLETALFPVVKYTAVTNPSNAPTGAGGGGISYSATPGTYAYPIFYAISWNGPIGETTLSPILSANVNNPRSNWPTLGTPGYVTVTRNNTAPSGARSWNLYAAIAAPTGTIQPTDMLLLAGGLDLAQTSFIDNGTLAFNLGQVAPIANSTAGPKVDQGIVADGSPILWADQDNPYNIWIGGAGPYALDFSISNGGYRAEPEQGTNYYPTAIIGFRTGQGAPSLTVLYSNTEGLSKQAVLQQQTITYGDASFSVWGVTEQHYGAAGVAAPNSAVNYNGKLAFLSTDGIVFMETQPTIQNVLSTTPVSIPIDPYIRSIKVDAMEKVVGTGWNNKFMWIVPNGGFDTPQQILILDTNQKGVEGKGAWYSMNILADWIGVISPQNAPAFVYITQGTQSFKLLVAAATFDTINGFNVPFSTDAVGPLSAISGDAHNTWQAAIQAVFNLVGLVGDVTVGVRYRNQSGNMKERSKTYSAPAFVPSSAGGWGDPKYSFANFPQIPGWGSCAPIDDSVAAYATVDKRVAVRIDDIINEAQWFLHTDVGYNNYQLRAVSYEGINLGVRPDVA